MTHYIVVGKSDIGNSRKINQDSLLVKHILYGDIEILMAIICDGMGGLSKGELASATIIRTFNEWFESNILYEVQNLDLKVISHKWILILKNLNIKIQDYSKQFDLKIGSTFTGILFIDNQYIIVHIGDTRVYQIDESIKQLTEDHTLVARKVENGELTLDQAQFDKRQNILLQCVGASNIINPQVIYGKSQQGYYLLCSDGLRHKLNETEMISLINYKKLKNKKKMGKKMDEMIEIVKSRGEKDNISMILIKSF